KARERDDRENTHKRRSLPRCEDVIAWRRRHGNQRFPASSTIRDGPRREPRVKIAVLFGGDSMERDVSVASAAQVVPALRSRGHEVQVVDAARGRLARDEERLVLAGHIDQRPPSRSAASGLPLLAAGPELREVDLVFLAMHGGSGENGTIQALLDLVGTPYTGSGLLGSAVGMDKEISKRLFRAAGVPTPEWLTAPVDAKTVAAELGFPVIVKPNAEGSTVGLTLVREAGELAPAI